MVKMGAMIKFLACMTLIGYAASQYNVAVSSLERNCASGWRYFDYKCYKTTGNLGFDAARDECLNQGSEMIVFDYRMEMFFVQHWLGNVDYWIGLEIKSGDTRHTWLDGKMVSETYTRWYSSEPNNGVSYNVGYMYSYYFYDAPKSGTRHTLCEKRANYVDAQVLCASQKEIRAKGEAPTRSIETDPSRSDQHCSQSCLLQQYSYSARVDDLCLCLSEEPTSGTCDNETSSEKVYYDYTTDLTTADFEFSISQPDEMGCADPSHVYYDGHCYVYTTTSLPFFHHVQNAKDLYGPEAQIMAVNNEPEQRFIDEVILGTAKRNGDNNGQTYFVGVYDDRNICDDGWTAFNGGCFMYEENQIADTYDNKRAYCQAFRSGADIIWFEDSNERNYAMQTFMPSDHTSSDLDIWSGIYDTNNANAWRYPMWNDQSGHQAWSSGEGSATNERCAMMRSTNTYHAYDVQCSDSYKAPCRYNPRERDAANFHEMVNTDHEFLSESYSRWIPNHGYNNVPRCAYHHSSNKMWYIDDCMSSRQTIYEYPALAMNYAIRAGGKIDAFTKIEARLTNVGGAIPENSVDFGYDGQHNWDKSYSSFTHTVRDLGKHEVLYDARDFWYQRANGSATYEVVLPVERASVSCPPIVDTTYEMECEVAATGEASSGTVDFGDGSSLLNVELQDSRITVVGPDITRQSYSTGQGINGNSFVMYNSRFTYHGIIQGFEFEAITAGNFHFVVWRPRCSADQVFCSKSMSCQNIDYLQDVCETVTSWHKVNCGGNKWSLTERACVDSNGNRVADTTQYYNTMPFSQFDNVGEYLTKTSVRGRNFVTLKREEMIEVLPGDFLGFVGVDGIYADWHIGAAFTAYAGQGTKTWWPESGVGHYNYEFFLNAYVTTFQHLVVPHTYSQLDGMNVTIIATNDYALSDTNYTEALVVYELIKDLEIVDEGDEVPRDRSVIKEVISTFTVNDHDGHPVTYLWNFGDGTAEVTEITGSVNHSFVSSGRYNVTVIASNELSSDSTWEHVLVQAEITLGIYTQNDDSTKLGMKSVFKVCIDDGNEVTYSIKIGDGTVHGGVSVYEDAPSTCVSGFNDRNSLKCYQLSGASTYSNSNATCRALYARAYPAFYENLGHYQNAYSIYNGDDYVGGYHKTDGEWYDIFGFPLGSGLPFGSWNTDHGNNDAYNCVAFYGTDGQWNQRNCDESRHVMCMYEGRCETFSVGIDEIGTYEITLKAENAVSMVEDTFTQYIQNPIEGLVIHAVGPQTWGEEVVLNLNWTSGSMLSAVCYNTDSESGSECQDFEINEGSDGLYGYGTIKVQLSEYEVINEHKRYVKLTNMISEMSATQSFEVMYEIQELGLVSSHDPCAITLEDDVEYTLTAKQMSHATVTYTFADQSTPGSDVTETIDEMTAPSGYPNHADGSDKVEHLLAHVYPVEGTYTITINASNAISFQTISKDIIIENFIRGYRIERTTPVALWPGEVARVSFTLVFDSGYEMIGENPHLVPTAVTESHVYGHPDCSGVSDIDECLTNNGGCDHLCVNTQVSFYCICNYNHTLDNDGATCIFGNGTSSSVSNITTTTTTTTTTEAPQLTTANMWSYLGQTCPEAKHTDVVLVNGDTTDDDYYDYTHYGTFEVTMSYENCISDTSFTFTVDIDQPVMNLTIVSDDYILPWGANSTLRMNMTWGSRINLTYDFNDTNPVTEVVYDRLYPNSAGHTWDVEGTFYPTIAAKNLLDTYMAVTGPIYVQYILADALRVETRTIWGLPYPEYSVEVFFDVYLTSEYADMMPTNVTANVTFGDFIPGTETIATLLNQYLPDVAQFDASMDKIGESTNNESRAKREIGDKHVWTFSHIYTVGETYNVTIDFQNWVSTLSIDVEFHAMEVIAPLTMFVEYLGDERITIDEEAIDWNYPLHDFIDCREMQLVLLPESNCIFGFNELLGSHTEVTNEHLALHNFTESTYKRIPTNDTIRPPISAQTFLNYLNRTEWLTAECICVFVTDASNIRNDLIELGDLAVVDAFNRFLAQLQVTPPYTVADIDLVSADYKYLIDTLWLSDWMVRRQWIYNKTAVDEELIMGHKLSAHTIYSYPIEKAVAVYLEFERGTHLSFLWEWGDGESEITDVPFANHRFPLPAVYTTTVTAFNAISQLKISTTINIQRTISNLTIEGPEQVTRNRTNMFQFDLGTIGTDGCYFIDFKDVGTEDYPVDNRYYFIGDKTTCQEYFEIELAVWPQYMVSFTMDHMEHEMEEKGEFVRSASFKFGALGTYKVSLTGVNTVSGDTFALPVTVTKGPCFKPLVLLRSQNPCEPICVNGNEKALYKSMPIELGTAVSYNCTTTKLADHLWQIYRIEEDGTETPIFPINVTLFSPYDAVPLRKLLMPERTLDYGRYKFTLNVTMYDEEIWTMDTMYLSITKTPLKVALNQPVSKVMDRYKYEENYTMDALTYSYDPDDPEDKTGWSFIWKCRRSCESMAEYNEGHTVVVTPMSSTCNADNKTYAKLENGMDDGGCFVEDGYSTSGLFTNSAEGIQIADLRFAYEFDLIEFEILIFKDERKASIKMYLEVTQGMPPNINADLCISNCKEKVNYESIFSMSCQIIGGRGTYIYKWKLYRSPTNDYNDPLVEEIPPSDWNANLPSDGSRGTSMVQTGNTQASFALEPGFYTLEDVDSYFFVEVKAYRVGNSDNYGIAVSGFQVNEPPAMGNCSAFPLNGTAVDTKFNVLCTEFYDQHKPVKYQMGSRAIGAVNILWGQLRTTAYDPTGGSVLGQGPEASNFEVEIFVRAQDSIGGKTISEPMIVQIMPAVIDFAAVDVNDLASGDPAAAASMITAMSGGINQPEAEPSEDHDLESMTAEERAEHEAMEEEKRIAQQEAIIAFREKLAEALDSLPLDTLDAVSSVNQAAGSVAGNPAQMSENAIASLASVGKNSINVLNNLKDTMDAGSMNEKCTETLTSQAGAGEGVAHAQAQEAANPALVERKRRRRAAGETTTDELSLGIQASFDALGTLVDGLKVAGEGDTVIATLSMKLVAMKQFAAAFEGGKMASGGDASNGVALPGGEGLLGSGNDSITAISSTTNNYNSPPFASANPENAGDNSSSTALSGQILQIVLKDENGMPLNTTNSTEPLVSHIFMARDVVPDPIISQNSAAKLGESMITHKIMMPKQTSFHVKLRRVYIAPNVSAGNDTNVTSTSTPTPIGRTSTTLDPFLHNVTENRTIFDDLSLVFVVYIRAGVKPTSEIHDFNCTLPITYYNLDENSTVALGGTIRNLNCDDVWAEDENATCERHTLNRDVYPAGRDIVENNNMVCFIPNTWLDSYDTDLKIYAGVSYYYMNATNVTGLHNVSMDDFARGYMPAIEQVTIPEKYAESVLYEMEVTAASCKYWSPFQEDYIIDGCEVGPLTEVNLTSTHCICTLLSPEVPPYDEDDDSITEEEYERKASLAAGTPGISFGSGISIPMNTIDLSNSAFNNLNENPLVFSLMVSIVCLYLCACIWAAAQDRKDAIKAGVSPLLDNDPRDKYLYEVTVYTGSRSGSSTTAKISMVFSGEEDETQPRLIYDDKRPVLQSGGVDGFVMATPRGLGSLSHIRVWHDNSGKSPGWFFSRMQVVDMQTLEKYFFILDRWLSAGEDDGIIDRIVPLAGKDELTGFSHLFFTRAKKDLMDGHIWFSIFGKPHKSNFTRVQRLTSCLALLFASMVASIFLYVDPTDEQLGKALRLGPISLTVEQILTGVLSSLIAFPVNILIVLIFKNAKEPPYDAGKRCCAPCKKTKKKQSNGFAADELAQQAKILDGGPEQSRAASFATLSDAEDENSEAVNEYLSEEVKKRNSKFKLPWGFVFVAYFLAFCVTAVSLWYTVEQAGAFGAEKAGRWTAAFFTSIIESIFLSQPIKVLGLALFYALVIKKPDSDEDVDPGLEKGQEYLHKHEKQCQKLDQQVRKRLNKFKNIPIPPTEEYLMAARALRQKEMKMMDVLKEVAMYLLFLYLLFMVSYGNRDPISNRLYTSLYTEFHDAEYAGDDGIAFDKVTEYNTFWQYCNQTLLHSLWPEPWYDGVARDEGFTADRNMYRVGVPRLRQLRMLSEQCGMPMYRYTKECNLGYSLLSEDTENYFPGWIPVANESAAEYEGPYPGWYWESGSDLEGFPFPGMEATYGGGGFNIELGHTLAKAQENLNKLRDNEWLSPETRAVVIEFALYNSNKNLFAVSSMTFEFLPTGSVVPVYKMNLIRLDRYIGSYMITVMVSEILTFLYVFYFIYSECKKFKVLGKKYFKSFWNIVEFTTLMLCMAALVMFFCRFALVKKTAKNFQENPTSFVSFQFATTWEEIYGYLLAFIIFFANIKFLKLLRFNKKMTMLGMTMMYIGKPLLSFLLALGIVFIAFAQMAYLVFCRLLYSFSTFISASETLFTLMLNKFDYKELEAANPIFAPIIFLSFTVLVSFVLLSFMITMILEGFAEVTEELKNKENEYEIVSFIVSKFKGAVGFGGGPQLPPMNKEPDAMVSEAHTELMDRFDDFEEMFRDFCSDENKGDEPLVAKYEKEILAAKRVARNRTIYST